MVLVKMFHMSIQEYFIIEFLEFVFNLAIEIKLKCMT